MYLPSEYYSWVQLVQHLTFLKVQNSWPSRICGKDYFSLTLILRVDRVISISLNHPIPNSSVPISYYLQIPTNIKLLYVKFCYKSLRDIEKGYNIFYCRTKILTFEYFYCQFSWPSMPRDPFSLNISGIAFLCQGPSLSFKISYTFFPYIYTRKISHGVLC